MTSTETVSLDAAKLQELWDVRQIERVLYKYSRGFDRCDLQMAQETYWPEALDDHPGFVGNGQAMCVHWDNEHRKQFDSTQHYIMNNDIEVDGDTAHAESYVMLAARMKDSFETTVAGGRYVRRLEKRDGEWRIAATVCVTEWALDPANAEAVISVSAPSLRNKSDSVYDRPLEVTRPASSANITFR